MSKKVRALLIVSGILILPSWGFRLYILSLKWETDPSRFITLFTCIVSISIGGFLIWMGIKGGKADRRDYNLLISSALFTVGFWLYRLTGLILHPETDPNPRAHLRLTATFLVLGGLLLLSGLQGRKKASLPS
ncbi:MAG: hypothetical protein MPW16_09445 [Candidatus Manganitrophus sp.]|nr:MAG: hypothetical protein MPW16_09445 [Candidatus Manganitrophus sp.]